MALVAPEWFLTTFFGAQLSGAAPAFATLVGAMACLGLVVILTNYLFGAARRWIVAVLAVGVAVLIVLIHVAHGAIVADGPGRTGRPGWPGPGRGAGLRRGARAVVAGLAVPAAGERRR